MQKLFNAKILAKILIVDDNLSNILLLEKMLGSAGYEAVQSTDDPLSVSGLHQRERFDLILLDIQMPKLDGFGVMKCLRELEIEDYLPILVLTAQNDSQTRSRALKEGAKDIVSKPFEVDEVLSRVANMLEVRLLYNLKSERNEVLEEMVRDRTQKLRETNLQIVRYLGRAAEYRDTETGMHVIRMSTMSARLGDAVGMDRNECELLLNASPMHDLGKIGIPDRILLKKGPLDQEEWSVMKTHTLIGAEILSGHQSDILEMAGVIALTHHERWDGSGYPNGLASEEIPIAGRIAAVCDVYDALSSDRPYKAAWSAEDAVGYIRSGSGQQFDPELVDLFISILPEVLKVRKDYPDPADVRVRMPGRVFSPRNPSRKFWKWRNLSAKRFRRPVLENGVKSAPIQTSALRDLDARR